MYCENEHLNPSAKHEQCSFQIVMQGHSLDWIPWCIFFSFTRDFVLSVEFPPKRPEKESWNSLEFFHDGIRRRHYGSQMISLSKNSSSFFLQSSMKEIQPRQVFILKVLVIAPNFKASSIFQFLHCLHVWQPHDPMIIKTFHFCGKRT